MRDMTTVSFPGLGLDAFSLNKVAFSLGTIEVRWYGIFVTLGIALAFAYAIWRGKKNENFSPDDVIDVGLFTVVLGIIGARLYYVLTTLDDYNYSSLYKIIAIWEGGLAIYGGIIGGCLGILLACILKKKKWQKAFDMIGPGVLLAQAVGRWGNFFNGEAYGYPIGETTRYFFFNTEYTIPSGEGSFFHTMRMGLDVYGNYYYHPTFLYECVWNLLGFVLINLFYKHKKFDGQIALMYFTWYGFGRMFVEGFRTDSLYIPGTTLRISQCLGFACFLIGTALLILLSVLTYRREKASAALVSDSGTAETVQESETATEEIDTSKEETDAAEEETNVIAEETDSSEEEIDTSEKINEMQETNETENDENGKTD
ncbi:MAG: prolipoprotein diacylglyceryl transferase [Clostridia bacterium]|nr:prolipoprotein diacylglyceryl transferase [Clostridia bacterium]